MRRPGNTQAIGWSGTEQRAEAAPRVSMTPRAWAAHRYNEHIRHGLQRSWQNDRAQSRGLRW